MTKEIIRAQWRSRQGTWRIVKKTDSSGGGWGKFGETHGYKTREECQAMIELLIAVSPDKFEEG